MIFKAKLFLLFGDRVLARGVFLQLLVRSPNDVYSMNSLGYGAVQGRDFAQAARYFERVARLDSGSSSAHFNLAFVLEKLGCLDGAALEFGAAIAIEEKMDRAWYGLGLVYEQMGRLGEAAFSFERTTTLQPMSPLGWYQLARVHAKLGQLKKLREVIQHLSGFDPEVAYRLGLETGIYGKSPSPDGRWID
jgi:tetratricopeptide (TPR) repeat protein